MSSSTPPSSAPSETEAAQQPPTGRATAIILGIATVQFLVLIIAATNGSYGYFLDELYYMACSDHLAWGYVDHPPLSIALLALIRAIFGDAAWVIRVPPILAAAGVIGTTGLMARRLGAGTFGQGLATLAAAVTPFFLANCYSMIPFDLLLWPLGAYVILGILKNDNPKGWLLFGLIAGLGLQNKLSMGFFGLGLSVALLLTRNRKYIVSRVNGKFCLGVHLWGGAALAFLIFLPHLIWQVLNGWPTLEFMQNSNTLSGDSPAEFLRGQIGGINPFNLLTCLMGLYFYLFSRRGRPYRMMGIIFVSIFILLLVTHGKAYYLGPAYPMLFAGGAVLIESFVERGKWRGRILKPLIVTAPVAVLALVLPFLLPLLPPKQVLAYKESLGIPVRRGVLPEGLMARMCWEEFAAEVARVYDTLPEEDREESVVLTGSYSQAAAIDVFGKKYKLPPVVSYHNNYYLWGPGETSWSVVIAPPLRTVRLEDMFEEIVEAGRTSCEFRDAFGFGRDDAPIYVYRGPKRPIAEAWAEWKLFE